MGANKHDGLAVPGRVVLAHEPPFQIGDLAVDPPTRQVECGALDETIEPRVMQVLVALYQGGGIVTGDADAPFVPIPGFACNPNRGRDLHDQ